jgi:replicative DNA helicase
MNQLPNNNNLPSDIDIEQYVLGCLLLHPERWKKYSAKLKESLFSIEKHKVIFNCISNLGSKKEKWDVLIVSNKIKECNYEIQIGLEDLLKLCDLVMGTRCFNEYVKILNKYSVKRQMGQSAEKLIRDLKQGDNDTLGVIEQHNKRLRDIQQQLNTKDTSSITDSCNEILSRLDNPNQPQSMGIQTGIIELDNMTGGLQNSNLILLGGRPSMGKTTFATNIACYASFKHDRRVAIFSLEMPKVELIRRMICSELQITYQKIMSNDLSVEEKKKIKNFISKLLKSKIVIHDEPFNINELISESRRLKIEENIDMIFIDHLTRIKDVPGADRTKPEYQKIGDFTKRLSDLAKELKIPVVLLSQLSRAPEERNHQHPRPKMSDTRESGIIEENADVVLLLYRDWFYNKDQNHLKNFAEIILDKQRNGPVGTIYVKFYGEYMKFANPKSMELYNDRSREGINEPNK